MSSMVRREKQQVHHSRVLQVFTCKAGERNVSHSGEFTLAIGKGGAEKVGWFWARAAESQRKSVHSCVSRGQQIRKVKH